MANDLTRLLVESFLNSSWTCCIKPVVEKLQSWKPEKTANPVTLFSFKKNRRINATFDCNHFFLRSSVEYSNPQLTVEEVQGIIAARLLETSCNYFFERGLKEPDTNDIAELCELVQNPHAGCMVAFLLNTDDVEADRYSMNPLKESIVTSGQSAFPAAYVKTNNLKVDEKFVHKYEGTLISKNEVELINTHLANSNGSYIDFSDSVKYDQFETLSEMFGMDLALPALRMPIATLQAETKKGLLHRIISETHKDFETVKQTYECMGRSITNRTTLMTIPHSRLGYGSKRAARGKIRFSENKLEAVTVTYKNTKLYPNAMDPEDIAVADGKDTFSVTGEKLANYSFVETPSSPQFFLYSLGSPENAALWHGVGAFASPQLLQSCSSVRAVCREGGLFKDLQNYGVKPEVPMQLNLSPDSMWVHPIHRNIDASIGCVQNLMELARMGMKIEHLAKYK